DVALPRRLYDEGAEGRSGNPELVDRCEFHSVAPRRLEGVLGGRRTGCGSYGVVAVAEGPQVSSDCVPVWGAAGAPVAMDGEGGRAGRWRRRHDRGGEPGIRYTTEGVVVGDEVLVFEPTGGVEPHRGLQRRVVGPVGVVRELPVGLRP